METGTVEVVETPPKPMTHKERVRLALADWRERWPTVFTTATPLAVGIARKLREQLDMPHREIGTALHHWTHSTKYLQAIAQGVMRRNLDGSEAGVPDDAARQHARELLRERNERYRAEAAEKAKRAKARSTVSNPTQG